MIIKDKIKLQEKCSPVSVKEGEEIGVRLLHKLRESKNGIGLAANQIGINKRVCVVNVKEPLVLINPKIVEKSKEQFVFAEGCLSFPDSKLRTIRHQDIIVEADNHKGKEQPELKGTLPPTKVKPPKKRKKLSADEKLFKKAAEHKKRLKAKRGK